MKIYKPSENCYKLIRHFEGLRLEAYKDPGGLVTIGYGHTGMVREKPLTIETTIDLNEAEYLLRNDVEKAWNALRLELDVQILQGQVDALTSFVFNLGAAAFAKSTLLRKINNGLQVDAADEFPKWCHVGNVVMLGLKRRREAEQRLYLTGRLDL